MVTSSSGSDESGQRELSEHELWKQLTNVINSRSSQDEVLWSIFGTFWAGNAILLVALFPNGAAPKNFAGIVISLVGVLLSLVWGAIQRRALGHIERYEELMNKVEEKLKIDCKFAVSAKLNEQLYDKYLKRGWKARNVMKASSIGAMVFWVLMLAFFVVRTL